MRDVMYWTLAAPMTVIAALFLLKLMQIAL
jgi:hypothetical protein